MPIEIARVAALSITPVKALRIQRRDRLELRRDGAAGDRAMFLVDARDRMVNGKHHPGLTAVIAELDDEGQLSLELPDGTRATGVPHLGEELQVRFYSMLRPARVVDGPFSELLSEFVAAPLRLVAFADGRSAVDRGAAGAVRCFPAPRRAPSLARRGARRSTPAGSA